MAARPPIPIASPSVGEEEIAALREVIDSRWLTQGAKVAAFEDAFAARHGTDHAIAVTSCTTGLQLALTALGVGAGDEVIVPAFTWVATANAVFHCGATPVFADIERASFNIDVADAAKRVTERTRAVVPVHLFGLAADIDGLRAAMPDDVLILEDAACAAGGAYKGRPVGGLGTAAVFSFHPRKTITTGEGGMITTDDAGLAARLRRLRNHGGERSEEERHAGERPHVLPDFPVAGFNARMTDLQGAVGLVQLSKLDRLIDERRRGAASYRELLAGVSWLRLPDEPANGRHAWQAFVAYVDAATAPFPVAEMMDSLAADGISARPGTHAVHTLAHYRDAFGYRAQDFPVADDCARQSLALPLHNRMADDDYARVADCLRDM